MLSDSQRALLYARLRQGRQSTPDGITRRAADQDRLPLSFGQEQLWFLDRFEPGMSTYNILVGLRIRGPLDGAALGRAMDGLIARHEALRTRFVTDAQGRPTQEIADPASAGFAPFSLPEADLSDLDSADREARLRELAGAEDAQPFVLSQGPLLRARLVRLTADEHVLVLVVHHIVFDGWSSTVLLRELAALYGAQATGEPSGLAPLPVQFADFALWERERLSGPALDDLVGYWRENLAGFETLRLPTDRPRPVVTDFRGAVERLNLGADVLAGLRALSSQEGTTLPTTLMAAFHALLHRYSGQDDIVVGTLSANRGHSELAPLIGFLVNTLPVRADLSGDPTFRELLGRVREATVGAYGHQDLPFAKLVEVLRIARDPGRTPVFQAALLYVEADDSESSTAGGVEFARIPGLSDPDSSKFDLTLVAIVRAEELRVEFAFMTALFDRVTMHRMLENLGVLLAGVVADPSRRLSQLPVLTDAERRREVLEWNDTALDLPQVCAYERFEWQAERTPQGIAAVSGSESVTYAELNAQANRIAGWLRGFGVGPEVLVGVSMSPSPRRLAVLLGIMKAGGGYVPLDPALPADRLSFMMQDTKMPVVVADDAGLAGLPETAAKVVSIDQEWDLVSLLEAKNPHFPVQTSNVAYVIYTSGSTGVPKGVVVEHRQLVNHALGMVEQWSVGPDDRVLQFASLNFDVSVLDMFTALLSGACAVVASKETRLSPPRLAALIREQRVTFACPPPAILNLLTGERFPDLRVLMVAGEEFPAELAQAWLRPGLRLVNGYGPTEDTVIATFAELDATSASASGVPIGLPVANAQAYVLDGHLSPVPVGVVGELCLGGAGVARGYLNAPELTEQKFIPDPFRGAAGARLYKTGDLVRRLPSGNIVFVGRVDGQVKINGLRIELGEIEAGLLAHPAVAQAVVIVAEDRAGQKRLAGYVRPEPGGTAPELDLADLREHLTYRLPGYMIPAHLLVVDRFPLNTSGKIDKAALPTPDPAQAATSAATAHVAPSTPTETALTSIYASLLGGAQVGVDDDFFALGGNSLQAMQLVARIHGELAVDIAVTAVFLAPTPRQLAVRIEKADGDAASLAAGGPLVELTENDHAESLFTVHAIGGTVYAYAPLAAHLADRFKVFGIQAAGLDEGTTPAASLDSMATAYLKAIREAQPEGPYRLAGWSMGGLVAYEIARRLEALGEDVNHLVLLDAPFPASGRPQPAPETESQLAARFVADAARTLGWAPETFETPDPASPTTAVDTTTAAVQLDRMARRLDAGNGDLASVRAQIERRFAVFTANTRLAAGFQPGAALRAQTLLVGARHSPNAAAQPRWSDLLGPSATILTVDSDHYTLIQPPVVQEIAARIHAWPARPRRMR
jgi:amino acid adenylation domain-containing protein